MSSPDEPRFLTRLFLRTPILGYVLRCFREERIKELIWIGVVFFQVVLLAVLVFGLPALGVIGIVLSAIVGGVILFGTMS